MFILVKAVGNQCFKTNIPARATGGTTAAGAVGKPIVGSTVVPAAAGAATRKDYLNCPGFL